MVSLPRPDLLLSRDDFRAACFARDGGRCVACGAPAQDAHHILERRLFGDGGYYLGNGASVCAEHHRACEQTRLSVEDIRAAAGISQPVLPPQLYADEGPYTKWGDQILPDGSRVPGELFLDPSVQKILAEGGVLDRYLARFKYPRTFHVPFSPGVGADDRVLADLASFAGERVIVSEKLDGECTTLYADGFAHARSIDGATHPSQSRARALGGRLAGSLPPGWRVCAENVTAQHAIAYRALPDHLAVFSIWDETNTCLGWDETLEWCSLLGLTPVPVLYDGPFDEAVLRGLHVPRGANGDEREGWVMRRAGPFAYRDFRRAVAKYVRAGHVPIHARHWRRGALIENGVVGPP